MPRFSHKDKVRVERKFFQLLRLAIGSSMEVPQIAKEEWPAIYALAQKQALLGIAFDGMQKMGASAKVDPDLLMTWMGKCKQIERRNYKHLAAVVKAVGWFRKKGFRSCILKGAGNALLYPNPMHRVSGDIDVWVEGRPSEVIAFVRSIAPKEKASYHHIEFPRFDTIPVEVHYRPCYLQNPWHNHRLQQFFASMAQEQFDHEVKVEQGAFATPTASFNAIYQLAHIYNHLFQEGIGLRQLLDYYFIMLNVECGVSKESLCHLGLWKFAGAVMYVLHEVFDLPEDKMIAPMDERRGRLLLEDVLRGGNFGQHDESHHHSQGAVGHNILRLQRDLRLLRYYPEEALAEPFFRLWHFVWRRRHA